MKTITVDFTIPASLNDRLVLMAKKENVSVEELIVTFLRRNVERHNCQHEQC